MSFLSNFCGCAVAVRRSPHRLSCPYEYPIENGYQRGESSQNNNNNNNGATGNNNADDEFESNAYTPTVPLPRYTPHPSLMNEKTLEFERPARSSWSSMSESRNQTNAFAADEKGPDDFRNSSEGPQHHHHHHHHHQYNSNNNSNNNSQTSDDFNSDASSTLSYPSSYGNTSTATTSPPPPYSPHPSPPPAGSTVSTSMQGTGAGRYSQDINPTSPTTTSPVIHIPQPQPVLQRAQFLHQANDARERRGSGQGRNSVSLPPIYQRGYRM